MSLCHWNCASSLGLVLPQAVVAPGGRDSGEHELQVRTRPLQEGEWTGISGHPSALPLPSSSGATSKWGWKVSGVQGGRGGEVSGATPWKTKAPALGDCETVQFTQPLRTPVPASDFWHMPQFSYRFKNEERLKGFKPFFFEEY